MPSEDRPSRPPLESRHSTSSIRDHSRSPTSTANHKSKSQKSHAVGGRLHTRVPSYGKGLHKANKVHAAEGHVSTKQQRRATSPSTSPGTLSMKPPGSEQKLSRNSSATSLKRNLSHVSLKRNRSSVEVRRPKSAGTLKRSTSQTAVNNAKDLQHSTVHFDLGNDGQEDADGWTEASGSASPNISRSGSVGGASSGRSSAKPPASASNSEPPSPQTALSKDQLESSKWASSNQQDRHVAPDAKQITSRLLQRTLPTNAPPKMSSVSATATPGNLSPDSFDKITGSTLNDTPRGSKDVMVSRFMGAGSGTPGEPSPFTTNPPPSNISDPERILNEGRRAKSMRNLTRPEYPHDEDKDEERALVPRSRKSSTHTYDTAQQSRTQQKLWLQRASSNIEPQQLAPGATINGLLGLHTGPGASTLIGAGYDGRDPRIRLQLERTGLEYLVVRRFQDPVGQALKRLHSLPGAEQHRRIPNQNKSRSPENSGAGRYGLSQSLKETRLHGRDPATSAAIPGVGSSYNTHDPGSQDDIGIGEHGNGGDGGVGAILRSIWDKNLELSLSTE